MVVPSNGKRWSTTTRIGKELLDMFGMARDIKTEQGGESTKASAAIGDASTRPGQVEIHKGTVVVTGQQQ